MAVTALDTNVMLNILIHQCAMKIRVQRNDESITFRKEWLDSEEKAWLEREIAKVPPDIFSLAERFFECFPRFREIVFNEEITEI